MFSTASPLQLCLRLNQTFLSPAHITCLVADLKLYAELFLALSECESLMANFQTLTLLVPHLWKNIDR
jgi:hypothetical protein